MTEKIELKVGTPQKSEAENGPIWATPENLPFFKDENFPLFSYSYWSNVPKYFTMQKVQKQHKTP